MRGRAGTRSSGRAWARGHKAQRACEAAWRAAGGARGMLGERQQACGARQQQARGRRRQGLAGWPVGRPVRTWVCSTGPGWGFVHPDLVFGPV